MDDLAKNELPDFCTKRTLILGCGNRLFGDDGFGCEVIEHLQRHYQIPDDVYVMDVGTGVRRLLFTLCLSPGLPKSIVVIDAVDKAKPPGEIFELPLDELPNEKLDDFSLHQVPSSNLMRELSEMGVDVHVLACQVSRVPDRVSPGLSEEVTRAVPRLSEKIVGSYFVSEMGITQ
jgi:coenzyme F420 hydrogenase subunit delta